METKSCPRCNTPMMQDEDQGTYECTQCGYWHDPSGEYDQFDEQSFEEGLDELDRIFD